MTRYLNLKNMDEGGGEIWLALSNIEEKQDLSNLSIGEKRIYRKFEHVQRKREFLQSRIMVRDLAREAGLDVESLSLKKTAQGRPFGETESGQFYVSIAHTNHHVFCGLSPNRSIGVDLEPVSREVKVDVRKRILSDDERNNKALQNVETLRLWTIKEAIVKLTGGGMGKHMAVSRVRQTDNYVFNTSMEGFEDIQIYSRQYLNHWIAVAMARS